MNYCAIIAKVTKTEDINGADNIKVAYVLGEPVIVSKAIPVGHVGVFFPPDTELSKEFLYQNNLYRDKDLNKDKTKAGFFDTNGRVRAQPFMKVKSCGYFAELESLSFTGFDVNVLEVGSMFEELNNTPVAKKYINPNTLRAMGNTKTKARKMDETPLFHEHVETNQFKYHVDRILAGSIISIQAKAHGSSGRAGYTLVKKQLPKWKEVINKVIPLFPTESWDFVTGTRRVVLKTTDKDKDGYHGSEAFRFEILDQLKPFLEKGMTAYYEIIGFANGKPIMPNHSTDSLKDKKATKKYGKSITYSYNCLPDQYKFFIYRLSTTTLDGTEVDFTQPQLKQWCEDRGLESTFDVAEPFVYDGDVDKLKDLVEALTEREESLTEDYRDPSQISEGVVVRVDSGKLIPDFYKSKSIRFKIMEGILKDTGVSDMEEIS